MKIRWRECKSGRDAQTAEPEIWLVSGVKEVSSECLDSALNRSISLAYPWRILPAG
jgi:hypothetical protein